MMRLSFSRAAACAAVAASLSLAACDSTPGNDAAATDTAAGRTSTDAAAGVAASTSATPTAAASGGATATPTAAIVVLYNHPRDTAAFETYYRDTHVPLVRQHAPAIGFSRAVLMKFDRTLDGKKPPYYRKAELWFSSEDALRRAMETPGFKAIGDDFANFATAGGGPTILISRETNNP